MATGNVWPDPPQPCGIIAGTQSLSLANPTSWLTSVFRMIPGMPLWTLCSDHSSHVQSDTPRLLKMLFFVTAVCKMNSLEQFDSKQA